MISPKSDFLTNKAYKTFVLKLDSYLNTNLEIILAYKMINVIISFVPRHNFCDICVFFAHNIVNLTISVKISVVVPKFMY